MEPVWDAGVPWCPEGRCAWGRSVLLTSDEGTLPMCARVLPCQVCAPMVEMMGSQLEANSALLPPLDVGGDLTMAEPDGGGSHRA